jgi:hypothetical protein
MCFVSSCNDSDAKLGIFFSCWSIIRNKHFAFIFKLSLVC